jgi:6-phosphogluconate dehydrogenase
MQAGIVGLGRMGASLAEHAVEKSHAIVAFDTNETARAEVNATGIRLVASLEALVETLRPPRVILLYVPHGAPTEEVCESLNTLLGAGDTVGDGGNSHWHDSMRHAEQFAKHQINFLDIGTSGGVSGARNGACFMVGGPHEAFDVVAPLLRDLAVDPRGVIYAGPSGAGHFTKLVHNGIEFGMVQAIAEGIELLERGEFKLDIPALLENWQHGSVIRSWLVELMAKAMRETPDLSVLSTYVEDTGEVKWLVQWALEQDIPLPVISDSQVALIQDRDASSATAKAVALLRNQYGGHPVHRLNEDKSN